MLERKYQASKMLVDSELVSCELAFFKVVLGNPVTRIRSLFKCVSRFSTS